jgi:hypothetical protein
MSNQQKRAPSPNKKGVNVKFSPIARTESGATYSIAAQEGFRDDVGRNKQPFLLDENDSTQPSRHQIVITNPTEKEKKTEVVKIKDRDLYFTPEEQRESQDGLYNQLGLDPDDFDKLKERANQSPNRSQKLLNNSKDQRAIMAKMANEGLKLTKKIPADMNMTLTKKEVTENPQNEYMVSICNNKGACLALVVTGAVLAKQLGFFGGKVRKQTKKNKSRRSMKRGKSRKH